MPENEKTDAILVHLQYLREGQDKANAHLERQNGRLASAEARLAVLEDRSDEAKAVAQAAAKKWGAIGGLVGGVLTAIATSLGLAK